MHRSGWNVQDLIKKKLSDKIVEIVLVNHISPRSLHASRSTDFPGNERKKKNLYNKFLPKYLNA